ncbi:phosphate/phosphite/phosphonate ABC transporter substrate-binding protein [Quatrionicoccus australiensis]|uniref:phosphate/phosphite/phosphonate ABC transporter substrate-binding protein n=1 Tax=Quatrionicoccus australiensis TaxID=138118 RepID=UPI001CFB4BF9|nr:phosphate/phosphite/phosphonate ABC transporter substrate-binding protein [Quatrionicoccus australiensis]MCB4361400.1 phosphate/phosphite/phosphonate ABC transporter substrate-binding protein [Quatrionicoccus australiensis]
MKNILSCLTLACGLLASLPACAAPACDDPRPLRFALTPFKNPAAQLVQYQPLIRQLEKALERRVEVIPSPSYSTAIEGLLGESIDLAELGPASYAIAVSRGARITPFATFSSVNRSSPETAASYHSLLLVRRERGIDKLEQLRGSTLGLTDPASTSGAILPRQAIARQTGMPAEAYFKRITFSGSHDRSIEAVQKGLVDAVFVASSVFDEALRQGKVKPDELQLIWQSPPIPYDPFVLRDRLCPALVAKIRQVFLGDTTPLAGMLQELKARGFVPASDEHYREIRNLFANPR